MSSEWEESTIGNLCRQVFSGGTPSSTNAAYFEGGTIPWLKTKEVNYGRIHRAENFITELGLRNSSAKLVPVNSVIVAMYGNGDTAGRVAINKIPLTTNQACCNLVIDAEVADYRFVYYFLSAKYQKLVDLKNGGAQQNLNAGLIKNFPILLPPLLLQTQISDLLEMLDERISLLRETNATLEAIAQALFKSWFVDFDPVRANADGREPDGLDADTAALFPDGFEESELGLVPRGWGVGVVGDFAKLGRGSVNPLGSPETIYEHYSLPAFDNGQMPVHELGLEIKSNKTPLPPETVLLSKLNPHIPRVWMPVEYGQNAICSTEFLPFSPKHVGSSKEFIYCAFSAPSFLQELRQLVTGTSNSHQRVKPDQIARIRVVIPPNGILKSFVNIARPLFQRFHANRKQEKALATLRDTLLPRLISGQLRLPEAEAMLKDVA